MRTQKMRLLSFALALAMLLAIVPVSAFAEENTFSYPYEGQTLMYKIVDVDNKTVEVSKNQSIEGSVKIPETVEYNGETYTVVAIGFQAFYKDQKLTHVELPSTLKVIGESAFSCCMKLGDIVIPEGVTTIKKYAFNMVFGATSYEIPASVTTIEGQAFANNAAKKIEFEKGSSITTLPYALFAGNQYMEEVVLPEKLTEIGSNVFQYCKAMQSISLPSTIKKIGPQAFINCSALDSIMIPEQVAEIAESAFQGCSGLETVYYEGNNENLFDQVTSIDKTKTTIKYPRHVSFVMNGHGTEPKAQPVWSGDKLTKIADPTAAGYTFDGWYIDEALTQKFDVENDTISGDTTLYAKWEPIPDEDDSWDAATVVTGVVLGTGTAILAYHIGTELYAEQVLGEGVAVPKTREDVALKAWELAGKPAVELNGEPLSEAAQAEKWAVESGLMQNDANGSFNGAKKMNKLKALRVLDNAKKMNAQ